ncbi:nucleotidyltransferase domain-containing protein [bacterium]|nr:nucleotidyltransferase domain-containing protein [bacterium]
MNAEGTQVEKILRTLQERAKELNCLYRVDELLSRRDLGIEEICRGIIAILPSGWQYPAICEARIMIDDRVIQAPDHMDSVWAQSAQIIVQGQPIGAVEVSYRQQMPRADEGPFLKEERKLIDSVAERLSQALMERRLRAAFDGWQAALAGSPATEKREWWVVLEFLRGTDPGLLSRITRKMINHLSWTGVQEARELLQFSSCGVPREGDDPADVNRPLPREEMGGFDLYETTFGIAGQHLGEAEILACLARWIKEEKSSFLVTALENQDTPLSEISEALERYRHADVDESDLSRSIRQGLRASLARRFFSDQLDFVNTCKNSVHIDDFYGLIGKIVMPPRCHGKLGGKGAGLFLAKKIIENSPEASPLLKEIKVPKTWYIPSDGIYTFVHYNNLEDVLSRKYMEIEQVRQEYPHLVQLFKNSSFPPVLAKGLSLALDDFGESPIIVRSSSLLEDRTGSAFSGKYKSLFLGNQGPKTARLEALMDAIAEVYASVFGPDPFEYRTERNLIDVHEEMGILVQEVVGKRVGKYWVPACAGVAFNNNEFRWSARIKRGDGLIRLVPGLGTRAVDRVSDDYPVLIAPGQPGLRANVTVDETLKYSPKRIDVINLETNAFETVEAREFLREVGGEYPGVRKMISVVDGDRVRRPVGPDLDFERDELVFTFDGLVQDSAFVSRVRELLALLREKMAAPVDIEFAHDGEDFYLLQCRPQSYGADYSPARIPRDLPDGKVLFTARRYVSNGRVPDLTHLVFVDPERYAEIPDPNTLRDVGRVVGRLNKLLPKRQFALIGPGRWGSRGDIRLGVPVTYSDINNTAILVEVARKKGNYVPDLSFGTHFFQDLVEAQIRYLPLYPDDEGIVYNEEFLRCARNVLGDLVPEAARLADVVRVVDVRAETGGQVLRVLMNAELDEAVAFLGVPSEGSAAAAAAAGEPEVRAPQARARAEEDHWRWRFRMAERLAAQLDPRKYGVVAVYLFGSTKNANAGPASDIDLLIHVRADEAQRAALETWLDGWSEALAEVNYLRTGKIARGLLDVHFVTDEDIQQKTSYAVKIGAVTDPARVLQLGTDLRGI